MAIDDVRAFLEKVKEDSELHKLFHEINISDLKHAYAEIVHLAANYGFGFTINEYHEFVKHEYNSGRLSKDDLKRICGGASPTMVNSQITD